MSFGFSASANCSPQQYKYIFTVAQDGTGEYNTIQDAIDAIRVYPLQPITVYIKNGTYREKIELPANNVDVTFIGENVDSTIITWNDFSGKGSHNTFTSYTAKISGNRFTAENITFANSAGAVGQALALYVDADKAIFRNCKFKGNQDTIFVGGENAHQYFIDCNIEGTTDFIFGPATALFQNCKIRAKSNSFITAASTTKGNSFGLVFLNCNVYADSGVTKLHLGRPWRAYAKTIFVNCKLPKAIVPEGWHNWGNTDNEKTTYYAEFNNTGDGAILTKRVAWMKKLTKAEANNYSIKNILKTNTDDRWYTKPVMPFIRFIHKDTLVKTVSLYNTVPNNLPNISNQEQATATNGVVRYSKVSEPTLTIYPAAKPNGKAVIICPGGGYAVLAMNKEGNAMANEFNKVGITAFVLKYRLPSDSINIDKSLAPLQDAQQAIRYVRKNAALYKIDGNKIGIMGSSAGGHLAAAASVHYNFKADVNNTDTISCKPNFTILLYPVISFDTSIAHRGSMRNLIGSKPTPQQVSFFSTEKQVTTAIAPTFLVHAADDASVPVENSIRFYQACIKNKVPVEMHLYPNGGHGFGLNNKTTEDKWIDRLKNWLLTLK